MKILQQHLTRVIYSQELIVKHYDESTRESYEKERDFYLREDTKDLRPELIGYNDSTCTLIIEKATPICEIEDNIKYKDKYWQFLENLHNTHKINHLDCHLNNVVILNGEIKMIDWHTYTEEITDYSQDLYGWRKSKIKQTSEYAERFIDGICWDSPGDLAPKVYWGLE